VKLFSKNFNLYDHVIIQVGIL